MPGAGARGSVGEMVEGSLTEDERDQYIANPILWKEFLMNF